MFEKECRQRVKGQSPQALQKHLRIFGDKVQDHPTGNYEVRKDWLLESDQTLRNEFSGGQDGKLPHHQQQRTHKRIQFAEVKEPIILHLFKA